MHRIDGAGHLNNQFVAEDIATHRPPTEITADWMNAVQEEIANVIEDFGIDLNKQSNRQLIDALLNHFTRKDTTIHFVREVYTIVQNVAELNALTGVPDAAEVIVTHYQGGDHALATWFNGQWQFMPLAVAVFDLYSTQLDAHGYYWFANDWHLFDVEVLAPDLSGYAPIESPELSGEPKAPTPPLNNSTTRLATTQFVASALAGALANLPSVDLSAYAPLASPLFTGTPRGPTAAANTNTTQLATTAFVTGTLAAYALLASPLFTGTPRGPTADANTNTTQLATTAFVTGALAAKAPLASPALTGNPTAPTQAAGNNSTRLATTAFVTTATSAVATAFVGATQIRSGRYSYYTIRFTRANGTTVDVVSGHPDGWEDNSGA